MARSISAMRRGSSMCSIATIFAPVMVNGRSEIGLPSAAVTTPTAPDQCGQGDLCEPGAGGGTSGPAAGPGASRCR